MVNNNVDCTIRNTNDTYNVSSYYFEYSGMNLDILRDVYSFELLYPLEFYLYSISCPILH